MEGTSAVGLQDSGKLVGTVQRGEGMGVRRAKLIFKNNF